MRVLVACERSGVVRRAFEARGHEAWSCDLEPADDGAARHILGDALEAVASRAWDLLVAHPPCTHLSVSGAHLFKAKRADGRQQAALAFVRALLDAPVPRIALENPVSIISSQIRRPTQIIQPYQFGDDASKGTCLWLKGLPPLRPTKYIEPRYSCACGTVFEFALGRYGCPSCLGEGKVRQIWSNQTPGGQNKLGPSADRARIRAQTYPGIAAAMADQWGTRSAMHGGRL